MQKKNFSILHATIVLTSLVLFDLMTKTWGFSLQSPIRLGIINFTPAKNFGLVFGSFTEFKNLVRVVFFSTFGGYATALFFVILYFLKNKSLFWFKISLTVFISGIIGNVVDKTLLGFVRDFLNLGFPPFQKYAFNFADVYLFIGTVLTIFCIYRYGDELWNEKNNRKGFLINKSYQLTMGLWNVSSALLLVCVTLSLYSYSFLKSYIGSTS
ncbi:MAG: signal peptidase II [Bdellovibrionota bacterium]